MSTYSTNLAIELIGTGDQAGTWGTTTNTNLGTLIEQAISGYVTQAVATGTTTTITIPPGLTGVARNMFIELTGTGGTNTFLEVPANKKLYFIYNNSTGAVTVRVSGQTGVSVPVAAKVLLVSNGTDVVIATNYMVSLTLGTALPVTSGGTGATTASGARTTLSVPSTTGSGASGTWSIDISGNAATATSASVASFATTATTATNATNLVTANFTVQESGGKLIFKYGATTIASMDSTGVFTTLSDMTAGGTP